jgi:hypothetical protein
VERNLTTGSLKYFMHKFDDAIDTVTESITNSEHSTKETEAFTIKYQSC